MRKRLITAFKDVNPLSLYALGMAMVGTMLWLTGCKPGDTVSELTIRRQQVLDSDFYMEVCNTKPYQQMTFVDIKHCEDLVENQRGR